MQEAPTSTVEGGRTVPREGQSLWAVSQEAAPPLQKAEKVAQASKVVVRMLEARRTPQKKAQSSRAVAQRWVQS